MRGGADGALCESALTAPTLTCPILVVMTPQRLNPKP